VDAKLQAVAATPPLVPYLSLVDILTVVVVPLAVDQGKYLLNNPVVEGASKHTSQ
jgi:hypothetical protein